jgi:hypothetical protein
MLELARLFSLSLCRRADGIGPMSFARFLGLALSACWLTTTAAAQSIFTNQPAPAVGVLGAHADFSFRVQVPVTSANFAILVFQGTTNVSPRFTIVSQTITNTTSTQGNTTTGAFTVRISNLTAADVGSYTFEITVNGQRFTNTTSEPAALTLAAAAAPTITGQPQSRSVASFSAVTFTVQATGNPSPSYQWYRNGASVPGGSQASFSIPLATGFDAGVYHVVVTNSAGSITSNAAALEIVASGRPAIATQPASVDVVAGQPATFTVTPVVSAIPSTYRWIFNGVLIPDAVSASYTVAAASAASAGTYSVLVMNSFGSILSTPAVLRIVTAGVPVISAQPVAVTVGAGERATFTVVASGNPAPSYQWSKDGTPLPGATAASFTVAAVQPSDAGVYAVSVSNSAGAVTSTPAALTVTAATPGRIINLSILSRLEGSGDSFTLGYVVGGSGTTGAKPLVIRAAGPSLGSLGVPDTLVDPRIELFAGAAKTAENDNWGGSASLVAALSAVGAFPYSGPASLDAAIATSVTTRDNSIKVSGTGAGAVIAEIYDATPAGAYSASTPRLVNVSVLKNVGGGLTAGFVIGGGTSRAVLIRAVGPGLTAFGLLGALDDPELTLYRSGTVVERNNDWGGTSALSAAFSAVGAFALPPGSKDAALLMTLAPGNYSVQVAGAGGATGVVLVEVYEAP